MSDYTVDLESMRALIQGKFQFRNCLECNGTGRVLVDGDVGVVVKAPHPEADPSIYYEDCCEDCDSLGGFIVWQN